MSTPAEIRTSTFRLHRPAPNVCISVLKCKNVYTNYNVLTEIVDDNDEDDVDDDDDDDNDDDDSW
jgi:hypothetical protein